MIWVPGTSLSGPVPGAQASGMKSGPLSASFIGLLRAKCASKIIAIVWSIREKFCPKSCGNSEDQHNNCSSYIFLSLISAELIIFETHIFRNMQQEGSPLIDDHNSKGIQALLRRGTNKRVQCPQVHPPCVDVYYRLIYAGRTGAYMICVIKQS